MAGLRGDSYKLMLQNAIEVKAMISAAQKKFGTIHVLVNNAAGNFHAVPFLNLSWNQMQDDLDVIVKGAFHCCQEILPLMLKNKNGKIINIGTIATEYPPLSQTKYVAAKSAHLVGLNAKSCHGICQLQYPGQYGCAQHGGN